MNIGLYLIKDSLAHSLSDTQFNLNFIAPSLDDHGDMG